MRRRAIPALTVCLLTCAVVAAQQAPIPTADELSGRPFAIQKTWVIGGVGDWDYLTIDPVARQLFIAHGKTVQVVDIETGTIAGIVGGFHQAHAVVLDDQGSFGYATDGAEKPIPVVDPAAPWQGVKFTFAGGVAIFDRRTFDGVASILTRASLRALAFEPTTGLLFALGTDLATMPAPEPDVRRRPNPRFPQRTAPPPPISQPASPCGTTSPHSSDRLPESLISIIDPEKRVELAEIRVCGQLGMVASDGEGGVFVNFTTLNMAARIDAAGLLELLGPRARARPNYVDVAGHQYLYNDAPELDWREQTKSGAGSGDVLPQLRRFSLGECREPHGLAVDGKLRRLFVGCNNMKMNVLDSISGAPVASFTVGPGTDSIAYDAGRGLIFTANGGGYGSVSIIRQHLTDSYSVIQNLPTMQQARTMAVDPSTGLVYLVTTLFGANLRNPPRQGIGTLKVNPVEGSFQVLVVGN
jgi:DNA-binding beta-propeller fold protein YncE